MDSHDQPKRYLVIVQLIKSSDIKRISRDAPEIIAMLNQVSHGELEQAFRSGDGTLFGYFAKTSTDPVFLRAEFEKSKSTTNGDAILIIELGEDFKGVGFSRAWTWLQHH
jgi:hypothetical protein